MADKVPGKRQFECRECRKSFSAKVTLQNHLLRHQGATFPCTLCNKVLKQKTSLQRHVKSRHTNSTLKTSCSVCEKKMKPGSMSAHLKRHEKDYEHSKQFVCKECNASFSVKDSLKKHILVHRGVKFSCSICNAKFTLKAKLKRHVRDLHTDPTSKACPICKKEMKQSSIYKHLNLHKDKMSKKQYPCQQCSAKLASQEGLKAHMLIHSGQKIKAKCKICNIQILKTSMTHHLMTHQPDRNYFSCSEKGCNVQFSDKSSLKRHLLGPIHNQGSKKECPLCHIKIVDLRIHMKRHEVNRKKYPCPKCKKCFNEKGNLTEHMLRHTGQQKKECPICKLMCSDVKKHILYVHEQKDKETCQQCGSNVKHLDLHMKWKHGDNQKKSCFICNKEVYELKRHLKIHERHNQE